MEEENNQVSIDFSKIFSHHILISLSSCDSKQLSRPIGNNRGYAIYLRWRFPIERIGLCRFFDFFHKDW